MRRWTCDGCLEDIADDVPWFGVDEYDPDDEDSPENDGDYSHHFHNHPDARCLWAWVMARMADQPEETT